MRNASSECKADLTPVLASTQPAFPKTTSAVITSTTTPAAAPIDQQLTASAYLEKQLCRGESFNFEAPADTLFVIEESFYGISPRATCEPVNRWHCRMPFVPECNMQSECFVHLKNEVKQLIFFILNKTMIKKFISSFWSGDRARVQLECRNVLLHHLPLYTECVNIHMPTIELVSKLLFSNIDSSLIRFREE